MTRRALADEGAAALLVLVVMAVVAALAFVVVCTGCAMVLRHRVAAAADAAALAGATEADSGVGPACRAADRMATLDGGRLRSCTLTGAVVQVRVEATGSGWLRWLGAASLNARAGPADTNMENLGQVARSS
jgi:secretion/DNA translocation related TadE-like protein